MAEEKKYGYTVDIESHCYDSYFEGVQFGEWSESWGNSFKRMYRTPENAYSNFSSPFDIPSGTLVYVVWVEYSEGDSFGWADRRGTEVVAILTDYDDAFNLKHYVEERDTGALTHYSEEFTLKDGTVITFYSPWEGYFERLENVYIETTRIL